MKIKSLKLRNFRNFENLELPLHQQVNLFVGQNGQGKSNILEALELTLSGESFRGASNEDLIKWSSQFQYSLLQSIVIQKELLKDVEIRLGPAQREMFLNNKKTARHNFQQTFSTVVFTPDSLAVVKEGPAQRRAFLDSIAKSLYRDKAKLQFDYGRCLKTRNKVLKDHLQQRISGSEARLLIESLNSVFLPLATKLIHSRFEAIKSVAPLASKVLGVILNDTSVNISVDYVISEQSAIDWSQNQVYDVLQTRLQQLYDVELASGQSLVGPHKHDVRFSFNGHDARYFCSQGQQRAIVLAFKIAQIMRHSELHGEYPVLLLDDVFSELDSEKRECLLGILNDTPAQIFLTTTDFEVQRNFGHKETQIFTVAKGNVEAE